MLYRAPRIALLAALLTLGSSACTTPQIPLPPPGVENFGLEIHSTEQEIRITGELNLAAGEVRLVDRNSGRGIIAPIDAQGKFDTGFFAAPDGSRLLMTYTDGENSSDPFCFRVSYSPPTLLPSCP